MESRVPPSAGTARDGDGGFTLIELLVATAVLLTILLVLFSVITQTSSIWKRSTNKIEAFQGARAGFDLVTRSLSQATLNTYIDYDNATNPGGYLRKSELKFFVGQNGANGMPGTAGTGQGVFFQAPLNHTLSAASYSGLDSLLNTCGFYVSYTTNSGLPTHVPGNKNPYRYRLMQMLVPVEKNQIYTASGRDWFSTNTNYAATVADNVIALIVRAQDPSATTPDISSDYSYDSTLNSTNNPQPTTANQLPPVLQITMVAIDEASAARIDPSVVTTALTGKFGTTTNYDSDISQLESDLLKAGYDCRIFVSAVPIRESKWTK